MADHHFPVRPNLDQLKHQAKDLLRGIRQGDPSSSSSGWGGWTDGPLSEKETFDSLRSLRTARLIAFVK